MITLDIEFLLPVLVLFCINPSYFVSQWRLVSSKFFFGIFQNLELIFLNWAICKHQETQQLLSLGTDILMGFWRHFWDFLEQPRLLVAVLSNFLRNKLLTEYIQELEKWTIFKLSFVYLNWLWLINKESYWGEGLDIVFSNGLCLTLVELPEDHFPFKGFWESLYVYWGPVVLSKDHDLWKLGVCFDKGQEFWVSNRSYIALNESHAFINSVIELEFETLFWVQNRWI